MSSDEDDVPLAATATAMAAKRARPPADVNAPAPSRLKRPKVEPARKVENGRPNGLGDRPDRRRRDASGDLHTPLPPANGGGDDGDDGGEGDDGGGDSPSRAVAVPSASASRLRNARARERSAGSGGRPAKVRTTAGAKSEILPVAAAANGSDDGGAYRWWDDGDSEKGGVKWRTLVHHAVLFPPEYEPHGVKMLYDGKPVDLTPACEEVATFFAAKLDTDYERKKTFRDNFFHDFRATLKGTPAAAVVKSLAKCNFSRIKEHLDRERDKKKELPAAEKKALREAEAARVQKYVHALVDGREEKVGNFRVEPPGLFLGRGEHPLMGKVKARIYPEDVTINIGEDAPVPDVCLPGRRWGKVVHDNKVTWLCGWKDSITNGRKYVFLSAGSAFKGMSDLQKFEKARTLGKNIESIRKDYVAGWTSKSKEVRQRSVAMYLIDKLALRVGNEKNDDEADTVGCCSLRVEHIKLVEPRSVEFDFLGKDSMRYHNIVEVEKQVFDNLRLFMRNKSGGDDIFHRLSVAGLNDYLKSLMPGLSAKVFRTYNASVTLDRLLRATADDAPTHDKNVFYNQQNKEVAILCNHQRSTPKTHDAQMSRMQSRMDEAQEWLTELQKAQRKLRKGTDSGTVTVTEYKPVKPEVHDGMDDKARAAERKRAADAPRVKTSRPMSEAQVTAAVQRTKERLAKLEADAQVKDDLKTVALGTSKINYLDPRITVAWCKKQDVPIERIFASALLVKFAWAMPTPSTFTF
jgi:DNA topoisomerase I